MFRKLVITQVHGKYGCKKLNLVCLSGAAVECAFHYADNKNWKTSVRSVIETIIHMSQTLLPKRDGRKVALPAIRVHSFFLDKSCYTLGFSMFGFVL